MAKFTDEEIKLFINNNIECEVSGLIEWIAQLLPQADFDNYIDNIRIELREERDNA